jgi:hypothetical protein
MGTGKSTTGIAVIVDDYQKDPTLRIFSNVHLYGVKYVYTPDIEATMNLLNNPSFKHAKWLIDESYTETDCRRSGSMTSVLYTWIMQQMRKRDIEVIWVVQNSRMTDWRIKWIITKRIECINYDWDDDLKRGTHNIKCIIKKIRSGRAVTEKTISYYAPQYWKYFDTNELPNIVVNKCACGCGKMVSTAGKYLPGHYQAMKAAEKEAKELEGAEA